MTVKMERQCDSKEIQESLQNNDITLDIVLDKIYSDFWDGSPVIHFSVMIDIQKDFFKIHLQYDHNIDWKALYENPECLQKKGYDHCQYDFSTFSIERSQGYFIFSTNNSYMNRVDRDDVGTFLSSIRIPEEKFLSKIKNILDFIENQTNEFLRDKSDNGTLSNLYE